MEWLDKLEQGPLDQKVSVVLSRGMREELEMWAEVAGWSLSKTLRYLILLAMSTFEPDRARDYGKG